MAMFCLFHYGNIGSGPAGDFHYEEIGVVKFIEIFRINNKVWPCKRANYTVPYLARL